MPAKGLCMDCTKEEMQNAVQYMPYLNGRIN